MWVGLTDEDNVHIDENESVVGSLEGGSASSALSFDVPSPHMG